jgi:hypothetical protein
MKDVFIVFGVLLVVLILISTIGGSVRFFERYEDEEQYTDQGYEYIDQEQTGEEYPEYSAEGYEETHEDHDPEAEQPYANEEETVEAFDGDAYAGFDAETAGDADDA